MRPRLTATKGKAKVWQKKGSAHDPKHSSSSVKYSGGSVMAWARMAASGVSSLIFIDDVTHDGGSMLNSEAYKKHSLCQLPEKFVQTNWEEFIMQQDNDPKHTVKTIKDFSRENGGRF